ncbi:DUF4232 domain-containing protein [Streptomyces sp. NPDC048825]|uniref:DUF4232 domain-containing protein n=1 Tax=Streptomyces sp. NPDC048825 TaxID=3365592 RepID=UPI003722D920
MRTVRLATTIAASAALALTLTACGGDDDNGAGKPTQASSASATPTTATSPSVTPSASVPETGQTAPTADGGSTGSKTSGGTSSNGSGKNPGSGSSTAKSADCATGSLKFTADQVSRPVNHIVIKATNNGSRPCNLLAFPLLAFEKDAQAATAEIEESRPQAVVTLAPGATAYAGVTTSSGDGSGERSVRNSVISLHLQGRNGGSVGSAVKIPAPGGSLYVEPDAAKVTYWQDTVTDALTW